MKTLKILIIFIFSLSSVNAIAQKKKNFTDFEYEDSPTLEPRKRYELAEFYLSNENYKSAKLIYSALLENDPESGNLNYKLGHCLLKISFEKKVALPYLEKASEKVSDKYKNDVDEKAAPPETWWSLGRNYHLLHLYDKAITCFETYRTFVNPKNDKELNRIFKSIESVENLRTFAQKPVKIKVNNLGPQINGSFPDYAPAVSADEKTIVFTSRRPGSTGGLMAKEGELYEDLYIAYKTDNGWTLPVGLGSNVNSIGHEATISLSADGSQLFVYKDIDGSGDIYTSTFDGEFWSKIEPLNSNINTEFHEAHASMTADGTRLYFSSERDGENDNLDLYYCNKLPNGSWGNAIKMSNILNTPFNEDSPFILPDGKTMYFASDGHNTMGGYDIFKTVMDTAGEWSTPENIGYPLNSADDDIYFLVTPDGQRAYYASFRADGYGEKDIYMIQLLDNDPSSLAILTGFVQTIAGGVPDQVVVKVYDPGSEEVPVGIYKPNAKTGKYVIILPIGSTYKISYEVADFPFHSEIIEIPQGSGYTTINKPITLKGIKMR